MQSDIILKITTIYCLCDDLLKSICHRDDPHVKMSTAEIMTTALVASWLYQNNQEKSRLMLELLGLIPRRISKSRFNRRLHSISDKVWAALQYLIGEMAKRCSEEQIYSIDSMPVPVCDNIRIWRCRIYKSEEYRGYCASKRRYYFGLKVHLIMNEFGQPVEFILSPASIADLNGLKRINPQLPEGAVLMADAAYADYELEDLMNEFKMHLIADRKKNPQRPRPQHEAYLCQSYRKKIETTFSIISERFGRNLHAVTSKGFELKIALTIMAYALEA